MTKFIHKEIKKNYFLETIPFFLNQFVNYFLKILTFYYNKITLAVIGVYFI